MASVGGLSCDSVQGELPGLKTMLDVWHVPGLDGVGAMDVGQGDAVAQIEIHKFGNIAAVSTWVGLIEAMQGTLVTIVSDWAVTYTSILIRHVSRPMVESAEPYNAHGVLQLTCIQT